MRASCSVLLLVTIAAACSSESSGAKPGTPADTDTADTPTDAPDDGADPAPGDDDDALDPPVDTADPLPVVDCAAGPCIEVEATLDFGAVPFGQSRTETVRIRSTGTNPAVVREIALSDATSADFAVVSPTLPLAAPIVLTPPSVVEITVRYTRNGIDGDQGKLIISSTDVRRPNTVVLLRNDYKGAVRLTADPEDLEFGATGAGAESPPLSFLLEARGDPDANRVLQVTSILMGGGSFSPFVFRPEPSGTDGDDCTPPFLLPAGAQRRCRVVFAPKASGAAEDVLIVVARDRGNPDQRIEIPVQGNGRTCTPGAPDQCNDNNPCTTDACTDAGCTHTGDVTTTCDDGNFCSTDDRCVGGVCVGTVGTRDCSAAADNSGCRTGVCDADRGACVAVNKPDGVTVCNDDPEAYSVCASGRCIRADLRLSEVMYDPTGPDDQYEWVEIYNASPVPLNLAHYKIAGGADSGTGGGYLFTSNGNLSRTMPPGACWVVGGPLRGSSNGNPRSYDIPLNFDRDLQNINTPGSAGNGVGIFNIARNGGIDADSVPVDTVIYGDNNDDRLLCPNGRPCRGPDVGDSGAGGTIERLTDGTWDVQSRPTPGTCLYVD